MYLNYASIIILMMVVDLLGNVRLFTSVLELTYC